MYEYRLALEFWGSLVGLALIAPLVGMALRTASEHLCRLRKHVEDSAPLASVPSAPRPSWPS